MIVAEAEARRMRCCGPPGCGDMRLTSRAVAQGDKPEDPGGVSHYYDRYCVGAKCMAWVKFKDKGSCGLVTR